MKKLFTLAIVVLPFLANAQTAEENTKTVSEVAHLKNVESVKKLSSEIGAITKNPREQIDLLLLWTAENMQADEKRFFENGVPLSTDVAIKTRKGLCDEYANIFQDFCSALNIKSLRIEGYVKYANYEAGTLFEECNHAWNAVKIDNNWLLCDLFWASIEMDVAGNFQKKINKKYYLATPEEFVTDHMPATPLYQFISEPISMDAFIALNNNLDHSLPRLQEPNVQEKIQDLLKMSPSARLLQVAKDAFAFNNANPNLLITTYYNLAVNIVNTPKSNKQELLTAKDYFSHALKLTELSKKEDVRALSEPCKQGITYCSTRVKTLK